MRRAPIAQDQQSTTQKNDFVSQMGTDCTHGCKSCAETRDTWNSPDGKQWHAPAEGERSGKQAGAAEMRSGRAHHRSPPSTPQMLAKVKSVLSQLFRFVSLSFCPSFSPHHAAKEGSRSGCTALRSSLWTGQEQPPHGSCWGESRRHCICFAFGDWAQALQLCGAAELELVVAHAAMHAALIVALGRVHREQRGNWVTVVCQYHSDTTCTVVPAYAAAGSQSNQRTRKLGCAYATCHEAPPSRPRGSHRVPFPYTVASCERAAFSSARLSTACLPLSHACFWAAARHIMFFVV